MIEMHNHCLDTLTDADYMLLMRAVQTKNITSVVNTLLKIDLVVSRLKSALLCEEYPSNSQLTYNDYMMTSQQQEVRASLFGYAVQPYQDIEQLLPTSQSCHHELDMTAVLDLSLKKSTSVQLQNHHKNENRYPYQREKQICTASESSELLCQQRVSLSPGTQSHFQNLSCPSVNQERWKREINRHTSEERLPVLNSPMERSYRSDQYRQNNTRGETLTLGLQKYDNSRNCIRTQRPARYIFPSRRPKQCLLCSKAVRADNYIVHMRSHTGEKPYKCRVRPFRTANPSSIPKHMRLHDKGKAIYRCRTCSYYTVYKGNLTVHEQIHHGD